MDYKKSTGKKIPKALAKFKFHHLGKHFYGTKQVTMMRFCYVRYYTLSQVWDYWQNKADGDTQYIRK
jgi:hypothetical protein